MKYYTLIKWEICATCGGEGQHSRHLGSYSLDQFEQEFSESEQECYFAGGYDKPCERCEGTGKLLMEPHVRIK